MELTTPFKFFSAISLAILVLLPWHCFSQDYPYQPAKAKFYELPDGFGTPSGACGYGEYGRTVNGGGVVAVSTRSIYKSGARCGACYQIKCVQPECTEEGVKVVVTDNANDNETNFILNAPSFMKMATSGQEKQLRDYGNVDVNYRRTPCNYTEGKNVIIKILEQSSYPYYLSFVFLYHGGSSDITAVQVFEEDTIKWKACERVYGAVWMILNPPNNSLTFRLFLPGSESSNARWVLLPNSIPASWKPGTSYDTSERLS